jgi:hypothetical protein
MAKHDRATLVPDQREELRLEDDEPITLAEACKLFPRSKLTVSTLRAEADRKRLDIFRLGKRDFISGSFCLSVH